MMIQMPYGAQEILEKLNSHGFEAYIVGGCVRDSLLGAKPKDWDITTSAKPEEVKSLFGRTIDTGIQHGTVTIMRGKQGYEVTTYRIDGEYEDKRRPKTVAFTSSLEEDLKRRDFTINAMAYSPDQGIVDAFDGMGDLKRKMIRCVGDPAERFTEDALRILRAIRFSAQLDFSIEKHTWEAIGRIAPNMAKVSKERVQMELTRLLLSDHPERMQDVYRTGISAYISPGFHRLYGQGRLAEKVQHIPGEPQTGQGAYLEHAGSLPRVKYLRWAAFLRETDPDTAAEILKDLKMDNDTIRKVRTLVAWAGREILPQEAELRRGMSRMEPEVWDGVLALCGCDRKIRELTETIRRRGDCLDLKHLAVTGQDLAAAGVRPGKAMGEILGRLLEHVLERPEDNRKDVLLELAGTWQDAGTGCL